MTNRKSTKKALLMSALSLLLCFSMLVGTTFAWFTDSVESGTNQIIAGNLDVEVYHGDASLKQSITEKNVLFDEIKLWEPGVVAYENITVVNEGNLALKYQMSVNFDNENNLNGYGLSKVLKVAVVPGGVSGTREEVLAAAGKGVLLSELTEKGELLKQGDSKAYGIVIWWEPSDLDNYWNVNNGDKVSDYTDEASNYLHIDLGIKLVATQKDAELDSFGPDYDEGLEPEISYVSSYEGLKEALAKGGKISLMGDIQMDGNTNVSASVDIDLNGYTITGNGSYALNFVGGTSVVRDGTIQAAGNGKNVNCLWTDGDAVVDLYNVNLLSGTTGTQTNFPIWTDGNSVLNIHGGEYVNNAGGVVVYSYGSSDVYIYDGHFSTANDEPWAMINDYDNKLNTITIYGGSFVNFDPADENDSKEGDGAYNTASFVANGYKSVPVKQSNGDTWFYVAADDTAVVGDNEALKNAIVNDASIYLVSGEYSLPTLSGKEGVTIEGILGETVIGGENTSTGFGSNFGKNTTIKNVTFSGSSNGVRYSYAQGGTTTFDNCTFAGDSAYGFHIDESKGATFIFNNCTFIGFNAFASDLEKVTFNNCTFLHNGNYGHTNIWSVGEFNNCTWGEGATYGTRGDGVIYIDGALYVTTSEALNAAITNGTKEILLAKGNYVMTNVAVGVTIKGMDKEKVVLNNSKEHAGNAGMKGAINTRMNFENLTFENTVFTMNGTGSVETGGGMSTFTNVHFAAGFRQGYGTGVVFTDCSFGENSEGYALHFQSSGDSTDAIKLNGCKFLGGKVHLGKGRTYEFTNCDFAAGTDFQIFKTTGNLKDCTVGSEKVTAENADTLFPNLNLEIVTIQ